MRVYPATVLPDVFNERKARDWSVEEAEQVFSWFVDAVPSRVSHLLAYLAEQIPSDCCQWEQFLLCIGAKYVQELRTFPFSDQGKDGQPQLTDLGAALASDAGILVAHLLIKFPGSRAHWALLNDPGAFSHNHAVVKGFNRGLYLDPVGAVYEARALLNGKKSFELLRNVFSFWKERFA